MRLMMQIRWPVIYFFYGIVFVTSISVHAQNLEVTFSEFKEGKIVVHYSLVDSIAGRFYTIRLYASKDNFLNPLEKVSGEIGLEVKPGPDNKIVWDVSQELGSAFIGKVALEIRGRIFVPFINTESLNQNKIYKRKRKYTITWSGGTPQNILNFDLYNKDKKVITYSNIANVGTYGLEFPGYIKPGKNYRFRISDSKNKEEVVFTNSFRIKRKIPLLIKAIPAAAVAASLYVLLQPKNTEPDLPYPLPPKK